MRGQKLRSRGRVLINRVGEACALREQGDSSYRIGAVPNRNCREQTGEQQKSEADYLGALRPQGPRAGHGFTDTLTLPVVQQHWNPPPPSPE